MWGGLLAAALGSGVAAFSALRNAGRASARVHVEHNLKAVPGGIDTAERVVRAAGMAGRDPASSLTELQQILEVPAGNLDIESINGPHLKRYAQSYLGRPLDPTLLSTPGRRIVALDGLDGLARTVEALLSSKGSEEILIFVSDDPDTAEALKRYRNPERGVFTGRARGLFSGATLHVDALKDYLPPEGLPFALVAPSKYRPDREVPFQPLESVLKLIELLDRLRRVVDAYA
jgi:hypothetical protein